MLLRSKNLLDIITYGHPDLTIPSAPVHAVDQEIRELVRDMLRTMYRAPGVGLAAPQVDVLKRVCVVGFDEDGEHHELAIINPRITGHFGQETGYDEGCLSVPGIHSIVYRPAGILVEGIDINEEPLKFHAEGFLARVLQHEIDHLDGILFVDRLEAAAKEKVTQSLDRLQARTLKKIAGSSGKKS
ncbi:MAG TPA: peptide deformylase [Spirochaetota bacterium]|nr:peptide deformylase [Spirochaetota bacterium]